MNYFNYDLNLSEVRIYNQITLNGSSDISLAEFPILYYSVGILYKIFGNNDSIFRIFNALILLTGMFFLMKSVYILIKDKFWSIAIPVLFFTSPTLIYYGNGFLPDTTALGIVLIALYYIVRFYESEKIKYVYFASIIFTFAGLLKITSLLSFLGLIGTFVLFWIFSKEFRLKYKLHLFIIPFILPLIASLLWYNFVDQFHAKNGGSISPISLRPLWELSDEVITKTWSRIQMEWLRSYFPTSMHIFGLVSLLFSVIFIKRHNKFLVIFTIISLLGGTFFFFGFFRSLFDHDYYLINVFIVEIFCIILGLLLIKSFNHKIFNLSYLKILVLIALPFIIIQSNKIVHTKTYGYYNNAHKTVHSGLVGIEKLNRSLGIEKTDLVISVPDPSIDISLYLMNQPGFNDYGFITKKGAERMDFFIDKGAKYLFVADTNMLTSEKRAYLKPYCKNKIANYKNVNIYDLRAFPQSTTDK
ncbi:MAG: glycosyltransferase family 39 protein [Bacteroidales bacterium]|nr:glycosyltransferase family 39 protein [Bacteroidales bacterium]